LDPVCLNFLENMLDSSSDEEEKDEPEVKIPQKSNSM
jgi:hypothetical protein